MVSLEVKHLHSCSCCTKYWGTCGWNCEGTTPTVCVHCKKPCSECEQVEWNEDWRYWSNNAE